MFSEGVIYSIIAGLSFTLLPLLVHLVDESDRANHISSINVVTPAVINLLANLSLLDGRGASSQLLDEFEGIDHLLQRLCPLLGDGHKCD